MNATATIQPATATVAAAQLDRARHHRAPRGHAHPAHLGPDPGAAGDHDDAVLPDLRQPDRLAHRQMDGISYMDFIVPGPGDDERDPEQLRQHLLELLRRQVRPPRRGAAGQPDAELGDPRRLRRRRRAARADGRRDRAADRDVLHHVRVAASAGHAAHRAARARRSSRWPASSTRCTRRSSTTSRSSRPSS